MKNPYFFANNTESLFLTLFSFGVSSMCQHRSNCPINTEKRKQFFLKVQIVWHQVCFKIKCKIADAVFSVISTNSHCLVNLKTFVKIYNSLDAFKSLVRSSKSLRF